MDHSEGGGARIEGEYVQNVSPLLIQEAAYLDHDRINDLCNQMGSKQAEDIFCRAIEDLAERLSRVTVAVNQGKFATVVKHAKGLSAGAEQVGMVSLSAVAMDVAICAQAMNQVALAATIARLVRVGDQSLMLMWDTQDLSV